MGFPVDTIAARATAPGPGAVAVVRISGPDALPVLRRVAPGLEDTDIRQAGPPRLVDICDPDEGDPLDQALVTFFPSPRSYTGEDVVEISGHGGVLAPALVLDAVLRAGARQAEAGEFTRRAYLNGKLDLTQAEAVLDLIEGRSRAQHRAAVHHLERGLSRRIGELRDAVIGLEAVLVHHLDFPDEDEPPTSVDEIRARAEAVAERLAALGNTAPEGRLLRQGALVVLAGSPNAGKSTLFNALAGEERALVTSTPGTTRDAIEVDVSMGGYPFRLVDTAGLRETDEEVEQMGIEVAERYLASADLVLFCVESGRELRKDEVEFLSREGRHGVLLRTKADGREARDPVRSQGPSEGGAKGWPELRVSAHTGHGLGELQELLPSLVFEGLVRRGPEAPLLTRERQSRAVTAAEKEVRAFAESIGGGVPAEVASAHLKTALSELEAVVGVLSSDEVLDRVFGSFCIGK